MALINCPECNKEVSDKAASCPICGTAIASNETEPPTPKTCPDGNSEVKEIGTFCPW